MCTEFLQTDADVMVIIDDDIVWEAEDFWKIVEGCRETRSIYGAAYVTRSTEPHISSRHFPGSEIIFQQTPNRRPIEYQYLATGFMAIHRDVFEAMLATEYIDAYGTHRLEQVELGADRPFTPFFSPFVCREENGQLHYLSEDWAFSNRARQAGLKIWVDQSIILIHMGWYPFTVRDLKDAEHGLPSTGIDVVEVEGVPPPPTGDPLIDNLIPDIAEFMEESEGDTRRTMNVATKFLFERWNRKKVTEEEWYQDEETGLLYIHDLAGWHMRGGCPVSLAPLTAGKKMLDFGAGIGTFGMACARAGAEVAIHEVNPVTREFANWRAAKYGLELNQADPFECYDVISCWHVFEHLDKPEEVLLELKAKLNPGGLFISASGFEDTETPMHRPDPGWDAILEKHGFIAETECVYRLEESRELVSA